MKLDNRSNAIKYWETDMYVDINHHQNRDGVPHNKKLSPNWPHLSCKTCDTIDSLCEEYYQSSNFDRKQEIIEALKLYEINVYKLLKMRESFGFALMNINGKVVLGKKGSYDSTLYTDNNSTIDTKYNEGIYEMNNYLYNRNYSEDDLQHIKNLDNDYNEIRMDGSRWCVICGARKPDVIDDSNDIGNTLLSDINSKSINEILGGSI